ncbi:phenylalanine--tRNA ligase subunit beta [Adlercreutzia murintestinalis]|uniref:phenylalanine--tRNA ligase subunit beta n=1 Tax=Adlercreutzia murintestinalis TaxID=2941325 RepID=UPI002041AF6E|nr:phenylalanine--tRNA ligase subunit beta [Adlercreutzia murintestinalis]
MLVSLKWLSEYVKVPEDLQAFCDRLDLTGTGVEGVEQVGDAFANIVTAKVVGKEAHPGSDHLWVCQVDVGACNLDETGQPQPLQIVCGAQNFNTGDHIVTALIGAELPGGVKIKKGKLRGVASCGMNCSERELGLGSGHDGIMILPEDAPVGMPLAEYLGKSDTVLDLEITPNRPDCLSVTGMAREVGAMYQEDWADPLLDAAARLGLAGEAPADRVSVTIEDATRCPRYTARVIRGVKIGPSPDWLVERLAALGQRSINNIVDVTNYILFLYGQPLHAFDMEKLADAAGNVDVVVRAAHAGEKLQTLDGQERVLNEDMTVIATPSAGAVALAGVMGGLESEVTEETTDIFLEAATFQPGRTSRTSRNLGLISESSMRYERGVDDHGMLERSAAAAALMVEVAGGQVVPLAGEGFIDEWPQPSEAPHLTFRIKRFQEFVGADIPSSFTMDTLRRLGCSAEDTGEGTLEVIAPTFRPDLEREIDLYEEVLRLWGMDRVSSTLPASPHRVGARTPRQLINMKVNEVLRAAGLNETMTYSFAEPADVQRLRLEEGALGLAVEVLNPLNAEQSIMRQTLLPGLLRSLSYNQNRGVPNVQLYEIGTVFTATEGRKNPKERTKVASVLAGHMLARTWNSDPAAFDFFDGKGVLESLARELALPKVRFKALDADEAPYLQPGRAAQMLAGGIVIGWVGEVHPLVSAAFDVDGTVVAFELDMDALQKASQPARPFNDVPAFPPIEVDQNLVVAEEVTHEKLVQVMSSAGGKLLESIRLFDVYRDDARVGAGKKSMAYTLTYRAPDRTLTADEVERAHERVVKKTASATGAEVRG